MALTIGTVLGPYEVVSAIGAGGMGEVYRARDTKLGRDVALKILPEAFARDPDRLARFKREAQLLAALNHPNIAAIYGFEDAAATHALVLELVDGPTLADRIAQGPVPADEAIVIATQIADALQAAHERGIVHRDLKPANVKLRPDGTVKVLDFGLAKALASDDGSASAGPSNSMIAMSPTLTSPIGMTGIGVILGTAAYMAPEQARGKAIDKRADIWAFGCLLYELLSGRRAFEDEDVSLTLSRILQQDPDWSALPANAPPHVVQTLRLCLKKDPRQRAHDIADVRLALGGAFQPPANGSATPEVAAPRPLWRQALVPISAAIGAAAVALVASSFFRPAPAPVSTDVIRFDYPLPATLLFRSPGRTVLAVSPDGRHVAVNAEGGLYVRSLDETEGRFIPGTAGLGLTGISNPVFSPDGAHLAYQQNEQLKRIAVSGGAPSVLAAVTSPMGVTWTGDSILYGQRDGIYRVRDAGGTPEKVIAAGDGEQVDAPQLLPGGDWVLFSATRATGSASESRWNAADIVAQSIRTHERRVLLAGGGSDARYIPPGYLVYAVGDGLFAVKFDVKQLTVQGAPVSMIQGVRRATGAAAVTGSANYQVTTQGALVYVAATGDAKERLVWVDRRGGVQPIDTIPPSTFSTPRLSSDGARVLVVAQGNVSVYDLATGREQRVASPGNAAAYAAWTTDERLVAFTAAAPKGGVDTTWTKPVDGNANAVPLEVVPGGDLHVDSWMPDNATLVVHQHPAGPGLIRMLLFPNAGKGDSTFRELLTGSGGTVSDAVFSPDGKFYAYLSNETGRYEVYIRPYPGPGKTTTVSAGGGGEPVWTKNGELFYRGGDYALMAVTVTTTPELHVSPSTRLFPGPAFPGGSPRARYSAMADGKRFIMPAGFAPRTEDAAAVRPETIRVVLNWVEELKRRLP